MSAPRLSQTLLKLHSILKIAGVRFGRDGALMLEVKPFKNGARCPQCGRRGRRVRSRPRTRQWRDLPVAGREVTLGYAPREIVCRTHGRTEEEIPWAARHARVSYRFEYAVLRRCKVMTQKAAAQLLQMPASTLSDQLHRSIERYRSGHRVRGLRVIGIDESSYRKRHKYATLVCDLERSVVVWVGQGRGRATIDQFFDHQLSGYQKSQIHTGCCDMAKRTRHLESLPECPIGARPIPHRQGAQRSLTTYARNSGAKRAPRTEKPSRDCAGCCTGIHPLVRAGTRRPLRALEKHNRRIYRAWRLKDEFEQLWTFNAPWAALRFFKRWTTSALRSRLEPLRRFVATAPRHQAGILAFVETSRVTHAVAEGLNRIVKIVKNRASGFRHLQPFADMIYLTVGDLDIPAQIPGKFRAI